MKTGVVVSGLFKFGLTSAATFQHETFHEMEACHKLNNHLRRLANALNEASDRTEAYKVLDSEGRSPGAPSVKWPLPTLSNEGVWEPGEWLDVRQTPENAYPWSSTSRALHVSNDPKQWLIGHTHFRIFEAEVSPIDRAVWDNLLLAGKKLAGNELFQMRTILPSSLRDFPATRVRLIRELGHW